MIEFLKNLDETLFFFLNGMHSPTFDYIMHWVTFQQTWYPFYLALAVWLFWRYKLKAVPIILIIALAITLSDQFTSSFMKPFFERPRPCYDPGIGYLVHVVDGCGGPFGFASSHASNAFTLVTLLYLLFKLDYKYASILFAWATLVSYSRVYVGVHYPGDVIVGALVGIVIGWILYHLYLKLPSKYRLAG